MFKRDDYKRVYLREGEEDGGNLGVRILLAYFNLEAEDKKAVDEAGEKLYAALLLNRAKREGKDQADAMEKSLLSCFGDRAIYAERIENRYCSSACCVNRPWLKVTTTQGPIVIGHRKRVIEINWLESRIMSLAADLFYAEDATKHGKTIHAWDLEKAKEYIGRLLTC